MRIPRIAGVDLAYAVSLFAIIAFSLAIVLTGSTSNMSGIHFDILRDTFAAIYLFLSGLTISILAQSVEKSLSKLTRFLIQRGLFFTLSGLILSFLWPIDILITLGICTLVCPLLLVVNSSFLRFFALSIGLITLVIGSFTDLILSTEVLDTSVGFSELIIDSVLYILISSYYSILPWAMFFIVGIMYSRQDFLNKKNATRSVFWAIMAVLIGAGIELITFEFFNIFTSLQGKDVVPFNFILPVYLPGFLIMAWGLCIIFLNTCIWINNQLIGWKSFHILRQIGSMRHTFYYLHFLVGGIAMSLLEVIDMDHKKFIALLVTGYLVFCIIFTKLWKNRFRLGPVEWVMDRLSNKNAKS